MAKLSQTFLKFYKIFHNFLHKTYIYISSTHPQHLFETLSSKFVINSPLNMLNFSCRLKKKLISNYNWLSFFEITRLSVTRLKFNQSILSELCHTYLMWQDATWKSNTSRSSSHRIVSHHIKKVWLGLFKITVPDVISSCSVTSCHIASG